MPSILEFLPETATVSVPSSAPTKPRPRSPAETKLDELVASYRRPIQARADHVGFLHRSRIGFQSVIDNYHVTPREKDFATARQAALDLLATDALIERFGHVHVEEQVREALNQSHEILAPALLALVAENVAYIKGCRDHLRDLKVAQAGLLEPNLDFNDAISRFEHGINSREGRVKNLELAVRQWRESGSTFQNSGFLALYGGLKHIEIPAPAVPITATLSK